MSRSGPDLTQLQSMSIAKPMPGNVCFAFSQAAGGSNKGQRSNLGISNMSLHIVVTQKWCHLTGGICEPGMLSNSNSCRFGLKGDQ